MADLALVIGNRANCLPLRVNFAAFSPVPDFAVPFAAFFQGFENRLIELGTMTARLEHVRAPTKHLFDRVAGDFNQRPVHMHNHPAAVADQHPFTGAVKDHGRLAQTLLILTLTLQTGAHAQKIAQPGTGEKNQYGTEQGENIGIDALPLRQLR